MQLHFLNIIIDADRWLFEKINGDWFNPFFDSLMPFMRESLHWVPLYLFLIVFITINFKNGWWWVLFFICTVSLTDMTGTYIFKHNIERLRPCMDPEFYTHVRLVLNRCGGGYSFISNHAANHFGITVFAYLTLKHHFNSKWLKLIFIWPALISYAQVYIGVHYPLDVICGAVVGIGIGLFTSRFFNKRYGITIFDK
jgi:membrane-associated phospholipid phosphatase